MCLNTKLKYKYFDFEFNQYLHIPLCVTSDRRISFIDGRTYAEYIFCRAKAINIVDMITFIFSLNSYDVGPCYNDNQLSIQSLCDDVYGHLYF